MVNKRCLCGCLAEEGDTCSVCLSRESIQQENERKYETRYD